MSESVYEKDGRRLVDAIAAMRAADPFAARIYDYSRTLVDVDLRRRECYSYGRHFPLFRYVPRAGRQAELFVINGDESPRQGRGWGGSRTPDHQESVRREVLRCGAASVVIPFSALAGAGIDLDSVRPVHVRPDKTWDETCYADRLEDMPRHMRTIGDYQNRFVTVGPLNGVVAQDETGSGYVFKEGKFMGFVASGGDAKSVIQMTPSELSFIQKDSGMLKLSGGKVTLLSKAGLSLVGSSISLGATASPASPAVWGFTGVGGVGSTSVFIAP